MLYGAGDAPHVSSDSSGLGYVNAMRQNLAAVPDATALTHYRTFDIETAARKNRCDQPWTH